MTSSKYIQLTDKILLEYEYFNVAETTTAEKKEFQLDLSDTKIYEYSETADKYIYNANLMDYIDYNMVCQKDIAPKTFTGFSPDNDENTEILSAHEFMLTSDNYKELIEPIYFTGETEYNCDRVKVYVSSSYDFDNDGKFYITLSTLLNDSSNFILASYTLNNFKLIDTPFLIGEKLYTKYIEFYVPSTYYMNILNSGVFASSPKITINLSTILKENNENTVTYTSVVSASISTQDQYATVYAEIKEVDDYFKLEGNTKNTEYSFSDFINSLPGTSSDYILMHDITVNELVNVSTDYDPEWRITTHNIITQTTDFDEPMLFRPVLKYSNCIACVIDYTLRIYCQSNNTQIIKRSTYQNFNHMKYGKKMIKINLSANPPQINVYNKIDNDKVSDLTLVNTSNTMNINMGKSEKIFKTSYITSFRDRINIKASISPVKIQDITE